MAQLTITPSFNITRVSFYLALWLSYSVSCICPSPVPWLMFRVKCKLLMTVIFANPFLLTETNHIKDITCAFPVEAGQCLALVSHLKVMRIHRSCCRNWWGRRAPGPGDADVHRRVAWAAEWVKSDTGQTRGVPLGGPVAQPLRAAVTVAVHPPPQRRACA